VQYYLYGAPEFLAGIHKGVPAEVGNRGYAVVLETLRDGDCIASAHAQVLQTLRQNLYDLERKRALMA